MSDHSRIKQTCPDIDRVISDIKDAHKELEGALKCIDRENYKDAKSGIECAMRLIDDYTSRKFNLLEDIRSANASLREWGNEQYQRAEELESKVSE